MAAASPCAAVLLKMCVHAPLAAMALMLGRIVSSKCTQVESFERRLEGTLDDSTRFARSF
eukprot:1787994-Pleurochrysis_carterae.AAC.1